METSRLDVHSTPQKRLKLIACEIFYRELSFCVAGSRNIIDVEFLPKGLHELKSERMAARIQEHIDAVAPDKYNAVLLGYALCNNGTVGVTARDLPVVIPRSHDCVAVLVGSRQAYDEWFNAHPGTYYKTTGWIERGGRETEMVGDLSEQQSSFGALATFEEYVEKYGEENARYLMEQMTGMEAYTHMAWVAQPELAPPVNYEQETRELAEKTGLEFARLEGDMAWFRGLTEGEWDEDRFLVLQPGESLAASYGDQVVCARCAEGG